MTLEGQAQVRPGTAPPVTGDGPGWPAELRSVFGDAVTVEYASMTASGAPITVPLSPYLSDESATIDVSTGLTYPVKAERARQNPKIALLCSDSLGPGREGAPIVLVQGLATVRDSDLQANTDRYVEQSMAKFPEAYAGQPPGSFADRLGTSPASGSRSRRSGSCGGRPAESIRSPGSGPRPPASKRRRLIRRPLRRRLAVEQGAVPTGALKRRQPSVFRSTISPWSLATAFR